jgi:hypothetical protein
MYENSSSESFRQLIGKTIVKIEFLEEDDRIIFTTDDKTAYSCYHMQECCEIVQIEQIIGDLQSICNSPIVEAEWHEYYHDISSDDEENDVYSRTTTTQYILTEQGESVKIIWDGQSNGCYGEAPYFGLTHY